VLYSTIDRCAPLERRDLGLLTKKLLRDIARNWTQMASIIMVVALGIIMFSGLLLAQRDLRDSINNIYRRTNYEDFSAKVDSAPAESVSSLESLGNVKAVEGRLSRESLATVKGKPITLRVITVPDGGRPTVDGLLVEDGSYLKPGEASACLVEHHLAGEFGLVPGDTVTLERDGTSIPLRIAGTVVSPEYLRLVSGSAQYVADPTQFGVVFMPYSEAARIFNLEGQVNEYVARVNDRGKVDETMRAAETLLGPYGVVGMTAGQDEPGAAALGLEISDMGKLALFFTVLLLVVASLAIYITMTQIVFSQQRQIGLIRAVGYGGNSVTVHYLGYGLILGVVGGAIGLVCGYLLSLLFIHIYAGIFDLPLITVSLHWFITAAALGVGLAFSMIGALVPARHAVTMKPAEAMRTEAGTSLGIARHHRHPGLVARLGLPGWLRITFRNIQRNRRRTFLTILGVVATLTLLVTATGGKDSVDYSLEKYLYGVLRWDTAVAFAEPVGPDVLARVRAINGVTAAEPAIDIPARLTAKGASVDVQVQAFRDNTVMHGSYPTRGSARRPGPGEIILNRGITGKVPVKLGDSVTVRTSLGSLDFRTAGFAAEPFGGVCYVSLRYIQSIAGAAVFNVAFAKVKPGQSDAVAKELRAIPGAFQVVTKSGIIKVFEDLVSAIKTLFWIFYVMALFMGFAILFSMITVNLLERRREIGTIRTLGAGKARIFSFLTVETVTVVILALIPGILLGRFLEWVLIEKVLSSDRLVPDTVMSGMTVAVIVIASLAVMVLSELPSIRRLWKMDLAGVTKERAG
jgi:putative ABC transport system permease protein